MQSLGCGNRPIGQRIHGTQELWKSNMVCVDKCLTPTRYVWSMQLSCIFAHTHIHTHTPDRHIPICKFVIKSTDRKEKHIAYNLQILKVHIGSWRTLLWMCVKLLIFTSNLSWNVVSMWQVFDIFLFTKKMGKAWKMCVTASPIHQ